MINQEPAWLPPGQLLKKQRKNLNLMQHELAKALGKKQHHISEFETGKRNISIAMAIRFGKFFNINYRSFL